LGYCLSKYSYSMAADTSYMCSFQATFCCWETDENSPDIFTIIEPKQKAAGIGLGEFGSPLYPPSNLF
jgi:hypothetical protein